MFGWVVLFVCFTLVTSFNIKCSSLFKAGGEGKGEVYRVYLSAQCHFDTRKILFWQSCLHYILLVCDKRIIKYRHFQFQEDGVLGTYSAFPSDINFIETCTSKT